MKTCICALPSLHTLDLWFAWDNNLALHTTSLNAYARQERLVVDRVAGFKVSQDFCSLMDQVAHGAAVAIVVPSLLQMFSQVADTVR